MISALYAVPSSCELFLGPHSYLTNYFIGITKFHLLFSISKGIYRLVINSTSVFRSDSRCYSIQFFLRIFVGFNLLLVSFNYCNYIVFVAHEISVTWHLDYRNFVSFHTSGLGIEPWAAPDMVLLPCLVS